MPRVRPLVLLVALAVGSSSVLAAGYAAKVNDTTISKSEVDRVLSANSSLPDNDKARRAVVEELVARELLIQAAKKNKLDKDGDVRDAINAATKQILFSAAADRYLKDHPVNESDMRQHFDAMSKNMPKEEYKIRHIMVKTQQEAEKISSQYKNGKSFNDLVSQSQDTETARKGGEVGWASPIAVLPEIGKALPNLKSGQLSDPIQTGKGWFLVEVQDKRTAQPPTYEQVKEKLRAALQQDQLRKYVQELASKAKIDIPQ